MDNYRVADDTRSSLTSAGREGIDLGAGRMAKTELEGGRFYGAVVNQWKAGNLSFSESVYRPGARIRRHLHSHPYFSILLHGSYREIYRGGVRECGPATAVLHA